MTSIKKFQFLLIGSVSILMGLHMMFGLKHCGNTKAYATVISSHDNKVLYSFTGPDNVDYPGEAKLMGDYPAGSTLTVYYNPDDPTKSAVSILKERLLYGFVFLLIGGVCIGLYYRYKQATDS